MFAELVISYFLISNQPLYLRQDGPPYTDIEIRLEVHQPIKQRFYLDIEPYVQRSRESSVTGRTGAYVELGYHYNEDISFSLFHHSSHCADINCEALEADGFNLRWRLN